MGKKCIALTRYMTADTKDNHKLDEVERDIRGPQCWPVQQQQTGRRGSPEHLVECGGHDELRYVAPYPLGYPIL